MGAGEIDFCFSDKGLREIRLLKNVAHGRHRKILSKKEKTISSKLNNYLSGQKISWEFPLDLEGYTLFQKKVWRSLQTIPHGEVRSYAWLAKKIGRPKAARAVGNALNKNPLPIIFPCHRIVLSDGKLGGFGAGLSWKKRLLKLEGFSC